MNKFINTASLHEGLLASIFLVSNRPENIEGLCDSIERTISDPSRIELLVKIDDGDVTMADRMRIEQGRRPFAVRYISTPPPGSHFELWESLNDLVREVDQSSYFLCNINDEVRFISLGWDDVLLRYVSFFPDDIFRLRVSRFKLRNYFDIWECFYAPENYAFHTKKWIDIQGNWNACHVSDAFQQCVAFYLALSSYPSPFQINRDIPVWGIDFENQEAATGLSEKKLEERNQGNDRAWHILMGPEMQTEICRRARLLQGNIWATETGNIPFSVRDNIEEKYIEFLDGNGSPLIVYSYKVDVGHIQYDQTVETMHGEKFHYRPAINYINEQKNFSEGLMDKFPGRVHHSSRPSREFGEILRSSLRRPRGLIRKLIWLFMFNAKGG